MFGDSFTYGRGLSDCMSYDRPPSAQAWPALLGNRLDMPVVNTAYPGASNIEILIKILNFKFKPTDTVVVGWTYIARDMMFKSSLFRKKTFDRKDHDTIGSSRSDENSKVWSALHTDYDLSIRAGLYIDHGMLYLNSLNLKHFHFYAVTRSTPRWIGHTPPAWFKKPASVIHYDLFPKLDKAPDDVHPGPLSQQALANNLYDIINK